MSFVVDAIKDIGSWIDDEIWEPIKDVGSWLDDEIFQPVIKMAEAQIQAIIDDPVKAVLKAVAVATGQAAWALPLIEGADAIDEGGNIGDALKAAAVSYVSMQAGDVAGEFAAGVGESVGSVITNEAISTFVTEAVTAGTREAIGAVITGQDPLDAFLSGGVSVGIGRVLGEVNDRTGGALDKLEELGGFREDDPNTPIVYDENGKYVSGNESQSVGSIVRDLVQQGVSDQLATGEINERRMAGIISSAVVTTQVVSDLVGDYVGDKNALFNTKMLTVSVQNALNVAMTEGGVSEAFMGSLARQIGAASVKAINEGTFQQEFGDAWDRVTGKFATLNDQGLLVEGAVDAHTAVVDEINDIAQQIKEGSEELLRLKGIPQKILQGSDGPMRMSRIERTRLELAQDNVLIYEAKFQELVTNELAPRLEVLNPLYDSTAADYQTAVDNYTETYATLAESTQELNGALAPAFAGINQATVENISPDFDAEFYAEQNGITKEEAYDHYLTEGLFSNIPANPAEFAAEYAIEQWGRIATSLGNLNIDMTKLTAEQITNLNDTFARNYSLRDLDAIDQGSVDRNMLATLVTDINGGIKVTEETNKLLSEAGLPPQEIGANVTLESVEAITKLAVDKQETQEIKNPYLNGATLVPNAQTGLMEWSDTSLKPTFRWSELNGAFVQGIKLPDGSYQNYDMKGNKVGKEYIRVTSGAETDLEWLAKNNPDAFVKTLTDMDKDQWLGNEWWLQEAKRLCS